MKKGLIFDLDGTLWDATEQIASSNNLTLSRFPEISRRVTAREMQNYMGKTIDQIARLVFPDMEEEKRQRIMELCCREEIEYFKSHGGKLYPGLKDALREAGKKYALFVVSNCHDGYLQAALDYHGLWEYFSDIEMAGRTGLSKSENISLVIKRNNLDRAIYVGDTDGDHAAARAAGVPFIFAAYGFGRDKSALYSAESISQVPKIAESIFENWDKASL